MRENVTRDQRRVLRADHLALGPYGIWAVLFILVPLVFVAYSGIYGNIKLKFIIYYSFSISLPTSFIFHLYILTNTILCQRNIDSEIIRLFATTDIFQAKPIHVFIIDTSDLG